MFILGKSILVIVLFSFLFSKTVFAQNSCVFPPASSSSLSEYAKMKNINVGAFFGECMWSPPQGEVCRATLQKDFAGSILPIELDWVTNEPSQGVFAWHAFDYAVNLAKESGSKLQIFHLIWNPNMQIIPTWLFPSPTNCGAWSRDQLLALMKNYIQSTIVHGNDAVAVWNVVNEAFAEVERGEPTDALGLRKHCFYQKIGPDYIEMAFKYAKEVNPKGKLILNDYFGNGGFGSISRVKVDNMIEFVMNSRNKGIHIEGIGVQHHLLDKDGYQFSNQYPADFEYLLQRAKAISVPVYITEMDVYQGNRTQTEVAQVYQKTMELCLKYSNCVSLTTFGISDKYSAAKTVPGLEDAKPLLFDDLYQKKPAYDGLMQAMRDDVYRQCTITDTALDGKDYIVWLTQYNTAASGISHGDFDMSGFVDVLDFVFWRGSYGK